jgi:hypothetical protein
MDASFERIIAQAVRGNQAAGPPQDPTVPDKCVLSQHVIFALTPAFQWRSHTYIIARSSQGSFLCAHRYA